MNRLIRLLRSAFFLARIAAPFVWMICVNTLRLELLAVITLWSGVPTSLDRMANEWLDRAIRHGWPTLYSAQLYYTFYGLALMMILIGWTLCSYLTVFIIHWLLF
jgi:hypothetical protein